MSRVTSIHNELDRIKGYSPFQWTFCAQPTSVEHGGHGQHRSSKHDGAKLENLNGRSESVLANTSASPHLGA